MATTVQALKTRLGLFAGVLFTLSVAVGGTYSAQPAAAQNVAPVTLPKETISLAAANAIIDAAVNHSASLGLAQVIVVVDENGLVKAQARMDGARVSSLPIAHDKAYTSAVRGITTEAFTNAISDNPALLASQARQPNIFLAPGGVPIVVNGQVVGAVGVSGATPQQDVDTALAGIAAIQ